MAEVRGGSSHRPRAEPGDHDQLGAHRAAPCTLRRAGRGRGDRVRGAAAARTAVADRGMAAGIGRWRLLRYRDASLRPLQDLLPALGPGTVWPGRWVTGDGGNGVITNGRVLFEAAACRVLMLRGR